MLPVNPNKRNTCNIILWSEKKSQIISKKFSFYNFEGINYEASII